jgi:hypothetical protein
MSLSLTTKYISEKAIYICLAALTDLVMKLNACPNLAFHSTQIAHDKICEIMVTMSILGCLRNSGLTIMTARSR